MICAKSPRAFTPSKYPMPLNLLHCLSTQELKILPTKIQAGFSSPEQRDTCSSLIWAFPSHLLGFLFLLSSRDWLKELPDKGYQHPSMCRRELLLRCADMECKSSRFKLQLCTPWKDTTSRPCMEGNAFGGVQEQSTAPQIHPAKDVQPPFTCRRDCLQWDIVMCLHPGSLPCQRSLFFLGRQLFKPATRVLWAGSSSL